LVGVLAIRLLLGGATAQEPAGVLPQPAGKPGHKEIVIAAGELRIGLWELADGLRVASILDSAERRECLGPDPLPLFTVTLRDVRTRNETRLVADKGWGAVAVKRSGQGWQFRWEKPLEAALGDIAVTVSATPDVQNQACRWQLRVSNPSREWSLLRVVFPQLALARPGADAAVVFPRGPGEVQTNVWDRAFAYRGDYPDSGCSMQFLACYRQGDRPAGIYLGVHDPWGSTKDLSIETDVTNQVTRLRFDHPVPNMTLAGNSFELNGEAVWQLFRGDWFDAALIYRSWVSRQARWWPRIEDGQRTDTALWMRELNVWAMGGWSPIGGTSVVQRFQSFLDLPVGFHWYNWHQIPFDNDYPHYFPARDGFVAGVAELQRGQVFVMPYINGRLWDTHDRGSEDFEFTRRALPAATKREDGQPHVERYGSKETNGAPVELAVMCPATTLWRDTVKETVMRLFTEGGVKSVYIDQVAAAAPRLCMDASHGHPLGGGHWWTEGYWTLLEAIRREMPPGRMITTECNAEPFIRWFDGYLTWHWQHDGQVPIFPAVYGGAIQMFGRAYRGGTTKDLALRMKAGQQLVFGEQLGWIDPTLVDEPENASFFRQAAQLRARLNRYFCAGEMARPPKLLGALPTVKADWQWSGEWWVSTDGVLTGAWRLPRERRLALIFVNVTDQAIAATLKFQGARHGIGAASAQAQLIEAGGSVGQAERWPATSEPALTFPPRRARAWELRW
jgi:hypothetical protein